MKYKNDTEKVPVVQPQRGEIISIAQSAMKTVGEVNKKPQRGDITCVAGLKNKRFRAVGALGIWVSYNPTVVLRANDSAPLGLRERSRQ